MKRMISTGRTREEAASPIDLLEGLISPVPAQMLVAPPPDSPPPTEPGESTPVTGSLATPPSQSRPRVAPELSARDSSLAGSIRLPKNGHDVAGGRAIRRGLAGYFAQNPLSIAAIGAIHNAARERALQPAILRATNQIQTLGAPDAASGRITTQPTDNPAMNQALATNAMSGYQAALRAIVQGIPGARFAASRNSKNPKRLAEKIDQEGQPAQTITDYGAAQITVMAPKDKDAVVAAIRKRFPVLRERDNFNEGDPEFGYRVYSMQVQMPNGSSEELQILPLEIFKSNKKEHQAYKAARTERLSGRDTSSNDAAAKKLNHHAMKEFEQRNLAKGSPVRLRDGSQGIVAYVDPNLKIVRVRTSDGRNLTVRRSEIQ